MDLSTIVSIASRINVNINSMNGDRSDLSVDSSMALYFHSFSFVFYLIFVNVRTDNTFHTIHNNHDCVLMRIKPYGLPTVFPTML